MATPMTRDARKICGLCNAYIQQDQYRAHVVNCGVSDKDVPIQRVAKTCGLCGRQVQDLAEHYRTCTGGDNTTNYEHDRRHQQTYASTGQHTSIAVTNQSSTKECIMCSKKIPEKDYVDHVNRCTSNSSNKSTKKESTKESIICYREVNESEYVAHVNACLPKSTSDSKPKVKVTQAERSCFMCSSPISSSRKSSHTLPCRLNHIYCVKCLQNSMNKYIETNTAPLCHETLCDYILSRYDVECLPLEADIIQRLLNCVKSEKRPQCPMCSFYVDFKTMNDLQNHVASCNAENLIPCEYCHCLCNTRRLDEHSRQCRNVPVAQRLQALVDFLISRTKYPLTAQQLRFFVEYRKNKHMTLEPHAIVEALAQFEGTFPFEIPTFDCGVCMESFVYDDIFVFGCEENHKLCYGCFENACQSKINNNEILTCGLCNYQLEEGEIKQLRIPADKKRQYIDYQTQKTFSAYIGSSKAIIKCPNGNCKWVAEASNPNDRFQVKCRVCAYEFCSLCNRQYHFRTTCQQVPDIMQRWYFWCNTERGNYWEARAQQDANFRAQLEDHERQKAENAQRNAELAQRYQELLADENYKAQSCRLCPHCQRVVQHLGGCDLMVCGRNYHGGDEQSGCGKGFKFSQALPYVPIANTGPQQVINDLPPPEQQKLVVHENVQCDSCHKIVQGIRFDCIHCSSLIFCEKCEQRATLEHANEIRNQNKEQHVFQLISQPLK